MTEFGGRVRTHVVVPAELARRCADDEVFASARDFGERCSRRRGDSGPAARADHRIDTSAGDGARTLLCDDQLPHLGIERSDRTLD